LDKSHQHNLFLQPAPSKHQARAPTPTLTTTHPQTHIRTHTHTHACTHAGTYIHTDFMQGTQVFDETTNHLYECS